MATLNLCFADELVPLSFHLVLMRIISVRRTFAFICNFATNIVVLQNAYAILCATVEDERLCGTTCGAQKYTVCVCVSMATLYAAR